MSPDDVTTRPEWYEHAFGPQYCDVYPRRDRGAAEAEVRFAVERLGLGASERVLDLCCGPGHHLRSLRARGANAVGVDLSCALLDHARHGAPVARGDMRMIPYAGPFAAVLTFFTTIGYFADDEENFLVLAEISRVLDRGGRFLIDYLNPPCVRSSLVAESARETDGRTYRESRWLEQSPPRVCKRVEIVSGSAEPAEYAECVRLYERDELTAMLDRAGLETTSVFGDFDGRDYSGGSPRMILVGRKAGTVPGLTWRPNRAFFRQVRAGGDRNFAYLFGEGGEAAAVDPVAPAEVLALAQATGARIRYVVNTHGHYDHTSGNQKVLRASGARPIGAVAGRTRFALGPGEFEVIPTPGHTRDSACILWQGRLLTGDTLFVGKVGGTGYGRDAREEYDSLHSVIAPLPDQTEVWPGHDYGVDPSSTVGWEKATNPFYLQPDFDSFVDLKRNWVEYKRTHGIA